MKSLLQFASLLFFCALFYAGQAQTNQTVNNGQATAPINFPSAGCPYYWFNNLSGIGLQASGSGDIPSFKAINTGGTPVTATITAKPVSAGFAYIPDVNSRSVSVINLANNTVISTIAVGNDPIGVSVSPDGSTIYISNQQTGSISVISAATNTVTATITTAVGANPSGLVVSPDGTRLYVANYQLNLVSIINTANNALLTTINVGVNPYGIAVSPNGQRVYVSNSSDNSVSVINTATNTVVATVAVGAQPNGLRLSPDGTRLYVANYNSNNVTVINTADNSVVATVAAGMSPVDVAISPDGNTLYVTNINDNTVSVINAAKLIFITTIPVGALPFGISLNPDGSKLYVTSSAAKSLAVINTLTNSVIATIPIASAAISIGNFISGGQGCNSTPVIFSITVNSGASPVITTSTVTGTVSGCAGTPSESLDIAQFTVAGTSLTGDMTVTPPQGFDISLTATGGYSPSLVLKQNAGTVISTIIYVRSSASDPAGTISGNLQITTPGASADIIALTGTVNALPGVNPITNQTVNAGAKTTPVNFAGTANVYNWTNDAPSIGFPASGTGNILAFSAVNSTRNPIIATFTVTPQQVGMAYIPNSEDNNVFVYNTMTNNVIASVPVGNQPGAVAISNSLARVYVANRGSNNITVIDATSNTVMTTIPVAGTPDVLIVSPDGSRLYIGFNLSASISVMNTTTNLVISTIALSGAPGVFAISPDGTKLYAADGDIQVVNTATNLVTATINTSATTIALSADGSTLYATTFNSNSIAVINTATNLVTATIGNISQPGGIAVSPDNSTIYVTSQNTGAVYAIGTASHSIIATIPASLGVTAISMTEDGSTVYAVSYLMNNVTIINTTTHTVIATPRTGDFPLFGGNFISSGIGCTGTPATFTITVDPAATAITASAAQGSISGCIGSASVSPNLEEFTVSGFGLSGNITATAPPGFEISLAPGNGFSTVLTLPETGGNVAAAMVFVRSAANASGNISGNVVLTSQGAVTQTVAVTGIINVLNLVNPVNNQTYNSGSTTAPINFTGTSTNYTWTNNNPAIGLSAGGSGNIPAFTASNSGNSPITATITVTPQQPGYAYVADAYNKVLVINTVSNLVVASIPVGQFQSGIAVSPDGSRVYVSNTNTDDVSVINTAANSVMATISTGPGTGPYFIALSPDGSRAYVANKGTGTVSVIDAVANTLLSSIKVGASPLGVAVSANGSLLYVINRNDGTLMVVNTMTNAIINTIPVGTNPSSEILSPDGSRLYITISGASGEVLVFNTSTQTIIAAIAVGGSADSITITPDGSMVYVTDSNSNTVSAIGTANNAITKVIPVGKGPMGIGASPDGSLIYVMNGQGDDISIISTGSNTVTETIASVQGPIALGNFISSGIGCTGAPVTFSITIDPAPASAITVNTNNLVGLTTIYGTPSANASLSLSGTNLTSGITVNPPPGFEVSLDAKSFSNTITLPAPGAPQLIYIRLAAATPAGAYAGNIVLSAAGAADNDVDMPNSFVTPAALTITANDATRVYGISNPPFTAAYKGFVNGDAPPQLTTLPVISTIATIQSPVGTYPITISGASSPNYSISFIDGTLTIVPTPGEIVIPNAFTPNGDGINDFWDIRKLSDFPNCLVSVYSRYGSLVFQSRGYPKPWDGTFNGNPLPVGTYYYIISPQSDLPKLSGYVVILR